MQDRIDHAVRQATEARKRATRCRDTHSRQHWLYAADAWEKIALTCAEFQRLRQEADRLTG